MGATTSSLLLCRRQRRELRFLIFGLDAAGKTSVLYRLKTGGQVTTIPTIGFNVETLDSGSGRANLTVWDLGGRDKVRPLYYHYLEGSHGILFVIDSTHTERLPEAMEEFSSLCGWSPGTEETAMPVAVLCNKVDLLTDASAASKVVAEVQSILPAQPKQPWRCFLGSAATGEGLSEAFDWLTAMSLGDVAIVTNAGGMTSEEVAASSDAKHGDKSDASLASKLVAKTGEAGGLSGLYDLMKSVLLR